MIPSHRGWDFQQNKNLKHILLFILDSPAIRSYLLRLAAVFVLLQSMTIQCRNASDVAPLNKYSNHAFHAYALIEITRRLEIADNHKI